MLYQNINKKVIDEASKLLAKHKLGLNSGFSITETKRYLLQYKIEKADELQSKLS